jgi:hypothetical protein
LKRLRYLDLSRNNLKYVENELLSTNSLLEELYVDDCGIKEVGRQFFDKLNKLKVVYAHGNKCIDGNFQGDVVAIRPNFLKCFENWDRKKEAKEQPQHSGEEL